MPPKQLDLIYSINFINRVNDTLVIKYSFFVLNEEQNIKLVWL